MLNNNNFLKWLALKYNKQSQKCHKDCNYFRFSLWNLFSPCSLLLKHNLKNPEQYSLKQKQTIHYKRFPIKTTNKSRYKGPKYCKFTQKRNKANEKRLLKVP